MAAEQNSARKPRADAERNRERLIDSARAAFVAKGGSASLEEIARDAGVGIGTLYRHFPTRDSLISQVYASEVSKLGEAAKTLAQTQLPLEALRQWLLLFVDYFATKVILLDAFKALVGDTAPMTAGAGDVLRSSINMLVERARDSDDVRDEAVEPIDLLRALTGMAGAGADWRRSAVRMVDLLIAGLQRG